MQLSIVELQHIQRALRFNHVLKKDEMMLAALKIKIEKELKEAVASVEL